MDLHEYAPVDWSERDAMYATARRETIEATLRWRAAGGYIGVDGQADVLVPSELWTQVVAAKHMYELLSRLAYPTWFHKVFERMRAGRHLIFLMPGEAHAIISPDVAIQWLEEDHFCLYSGFYKQKLLRYMHGYDLTAEQANRLREMTLAVIRRDKRLEFRELCRLARRLDPPTF